LNFLPYRVKNNPTKEIRWVEHMAHNILLKEHEGRSLSRSRCRQKNIKMDLTEIWYGLNSFSYYLRCSIW
jgi:hypothetical protein